MNKLRKITLKSTTDKTSSHPWIYKNHIASVESGIEPGNIVAINTRDNIFHGIGYYNPKSLIAARILSSEEEPIDFNFFKERILKALQKREAFRKITNAYRVVSSEADGLPGLVIDSYNNTAVFQVNTLGMDRFKNEIIDSICEIIKPSYIYEKSDSDLRKVEGLKKVSGWHGTVGEGKVVIFENEVKFTIDIIHGHKTGFYLDQRKNRVALGNICKGKSVLDIFCYTGGFAVHAALNGASEVTAIDIKKEWLNQLKENAELNNVDRKINFVKGNAFSVMREFVKIQEKFDIVILDPPSFLKNKYGLQTALKGYLDLNRLAMRLLSEKGVLCTFSCSHHMRNEIFSDMLKKAAAMENKTYSILKRCHQDKDHPIIKEIPETEYLKGYFLSVSTIE